MTIMKSKIICGWDPGETTGLCIIEADTSFDGFTVALSATIPWKQRLTMIRNIVHAHNAIHIVEDYTIYASKAKDQIGSKVPSARVIGIIAAFCYEYEREMHLWPASCIERTQILPAHAPLLLRPDPGEHARDAYKHARLLFTKLKHKGAL